MENKRILECVPNFSEGNDISKIKLLTDTISLVDGVKLLHVDQGKSANRTVVTFAGKPESVVEAAFRAVALASKIIDMRNHKGEHPRIGATDVLPLIPVSGITMEETILLANKLGNRIGTELGIPVYLYENSATCSQRKNLANCRKGEYEGLKEKLSSADWKPDFGSDNFGPQVSKSGAIVLGTRNFLIAYNINLNTGSVKIAKHIASEIRESGSIIKNEKGETSNKPGLLKSVKAIGWYINEYNKAQVSCNLTDYEVSPLHIVYETAKEISQRYGALVTGSELIGLIPLRPLLMAGAYYAQKKGISANISEAELVDLATLELGLNDLAPFNPKERILDILI